MVENSLVKSSNFALKQVSYATKQNKTTKRHKYWYKYNYRADFNMQCYTEHSIAMASHLSVCLSVRDVEVSSSHTLRGTLQNFGHGKSGFLLKCGKIGPI